MKKLNGKQKASIGFVGTILAAAFYILGGIFGWWSAPLTEEPAKEEVKAEQPAK